MPSYQITVAADQDLRGIWHYTFDTWGPEQADKYLDQIEGYLDAIGNRRVRWSDFRHCRKRS